jgi:hypothetical protein
MLIDDKSFDLDEEPKLIFDLILSRFKNYRLKILFSLNFSLLSLFGLKLVEINNAD